MGACWKNVSCVIAAAAVEAGKEVGRQQRHGETVLPHRHVGTVLHSVLLCMDGVQLL